MAKLSAPFFRLSGPAICVLLAIAPLSSHSCEENLRFALISEIVDAPEDAPFPRSVLGRYDSRTIGYNIAVRARRFARPTASPVQICYWKQSEIQMYCGSSSISSALTEGFLNFHALGWSRGDPDPYVRLLTESAMSRFSFRENEFVPTDVLPKYGMLEILPADSATLGFRQTRNGDQYGNLVVVLKNVVKHRSTWSIHDSFTRGYIETVPLTETGPLPQGPVQYFESQTWGEVDLRDIEEFRVPVNVDPVTLRLLAITGIRVHEYTASLLVERKTRIRGRLLIPGDREKLETHVNGRVSAELVDQLLRVKFTQLTSQILNTEKRLESPNGVKFDVLPRFVSSQPKPKSGISEYLVKGPILGDLFLKNGDLNVGAFFAWREIKKKARTLDQRAKKFAVRSIPFAGVIDRGDNYFIFPKKSCGSTVHLNDLGSKQQERWKNFRGAQFVLTELEKLRTFIAHLASRGIFLSDLSDADLTCVGDAEWRISGDPVIQSGLAPKDAQKLYTELIERL